MITIDDLFNALKRDRYGFIKGLIAAGYFEPVILNASGNDEKLVQLAADIMCDPDFDFKTFKSWVYDLCDR